MSVNDYHRQLAAEQIGADEHRQFVGGLWDELGHWQLDLLRGPGQLTPEMTRLDLACGCLRGGVHFISYLQPGHYDAASTSMAKAARPNTPSGLLDDSGVAKGPIRFGKRERTSGMLPDRCSKES